MLFEKTKPICSFRVRCSAFCGKENDKKKPESGVYSCSPHEIAYPLRDKTIISRGKFVVNLKKQSQFIRAAFGVLRAAERKKAKISPNQVFIRVHPMR